MVSNLLFGLAKRPVENAYFARRGVPQDCSHYVAEEIRSNEEFVAKHTEGVAHTYALWSEILPHLEEVRKTESYTSKWIRFVVWGNW